MLMKDKLNGSTVIDFSSGGTFLVAVTGKTTMCSAAMGFDYELRT